MSLASPNGDVMQCSPIPPRRFLHPAGRDGLPPFEAARGSARVSLESQAAACDGLPPFRDATEQLAQVVTVYSPSRDGMPPEA